MAFLVGYLAAKKKKQFYCNPDKGFDVESFLRLQVFD